VPPRATQTAEPLVPERPTLARLREAGAGCRACPLWKTGTQTVFGEGLTKAEIVFVGEQPGDREDREGRPFVGPAGRVLDEALGEAGIDRRLAYVTNAPNVLASREAYAALVADLRVVAELLATCGRPGAGAARRPS